MVYAGRREQKLKAVDLPVAIEGETISTGSFFEIELYGFMWRNSNEH